MINSELLLKETLLFIQNWRHIITPVAIAILYLFSILAACHILLKKRDPRGSLGWIAVCFGFPGIGVLAYLLFGINRVKTRGQDWASTGMWDLTLSAADKEEALEKASHHDLENIPAFHQIKNVADTVTKKNLVGGCHVSPLYNGEEAYPAMVEAISNAKKSVYIVSYIFESDDSGLKFVKALEAAKKRGVDVRVVIDGLGDYFSFPRISKVLKKHKVPVANFLPLSFWSGSLYLNLRNHRKIMIVDGKVGFTGGMNIRGRHNVATHKDKKVLIRDVHFRITGPVVGQLQDAFLVDWLFATGQAPENAITYDSTPTGTALCRGISDAPDKDFEKIRLAMMGALTAAQSHIRIMTPYFIPDASMLGALNAAALRGVKVEIILPEKNNINYMQWASQAFFWELLIHGVKIYYQPPPFCHSKLFMVDDFYTLIGSANWDPRSLRLDFEFNLEVFDKNFNKEMSEHFDETKRISKEILYDASEQRSLFAKLRDSFCKLFAPYL